MYFVCVYKSAKKSTSCIDTTLQNRGGRTDHWHIQYICKHFVITEGKYTSIAGVWSSILLLILWLVLGLTVYCFCLAQYTLALRLGYNLVAKQCLFCKKHCSAGCTRPSRWPIPSLSSVALLQSFNNDPHRFILLANEVHADPEVMDQAQNVAQKQIVWRVPVIPTAISCRYWLQVHTMSATVNILGMYWQDENDLWTKLVDKWRQGL